MKHVFLLSGKLQSGKNQVATYMMEHLRQSGMSVDTESYAKALKVGCTQDFQILWDYLSSKRDELVAAGVSPSLLDDWMLVGPENLQEKKTGLTRAILQLYGTEIFRNRVDRDYWVKKCVQAVSDSTSDVIFLTDVRFPNEVAAMLDWESEDRDNRTVITVRVERPGYDRKDLASEHPSETGLDNFSPWDVVIVNDGTLEDLRSWSIGILTDYKL